MFPAAPWPPSTPAGVAPSTSAAPPPASAESHHDRKCSDLASAGDALRSFVAARRSDANDDAISALLGKNKNLVGLFTFMKQCDETVAKYVAHVCAELTINDLTLLDQISVSPSKDVQRLVVHPSASSTALSRGVFFVTAQLEKVIDGGVSDFGLVENAEVRFSPVLVVSGDSGSGKTQFVLHGAYQKFRKGHEFTFLTYYVNAANHDGYKDLSSVLRSFDKDFRNLGDKPTAEQCAEYKKQRDTKCASFVSELVTELRSLPESQPQNWNILHIALDECGVSRTAVRGIVSSIATWAKAPNNNVRVTLAGTGLDYAIAFEGPVEPATNPNYFEHVKIEPWGIEDVRKLFQRHGKSEAILRHPTILALAKNARCAAIAAVQRSEIPIELVFNVANDYRKLNGLASIGEGEISQLIRTALYCAVSDEHVKAIAGVFEIPDAKPTHDELLKANSFGMISSYDSVTKTFRVTCAIVALCLASFGLSLASTKLFTGFEELTALFYYAAMTALKVPTGLLRLDRPLPPTRTFSIAAENLRQNCEGEVTTIPIGIPSELSISAGRLGIAGNEAGGIIVINGPMAPAWDVAVGCRNVRGDVTNWMLAQCKYRHPDTKASGSINWADELPKLGTSEVSMMNEQQLKARITRQWFCTVMSVRGRSFVTNFALHDVPSTDDEILAINLPGPFSDLAALLHNVHDYVYFTTTIRLKTSGELAMSCESVTLIGEKRPR